MGQNTGNKLHRIRGVNGPWYPRCLNLLLISTLCSTELKAGNSQVSDAAIDPCNIAFSTTGAFRISRWVETTVNNPCVLTAADVPHYSTSRLFLTAQERLCWCPMLARTCGLHRTPDWNNWRRKGVDLAPRPLVYQGPLATSYCVMPSWKIDDVLIPRFVPEFPQSRLGSQDT